jgi:hypothetical protein
MDVYTSGAFQLGSAAVKFFEITDGLSNTLLAGEKHVPLGGWGVGYLDSSEYNGDCLVSCTRPAGKKAGLAQTLTDPEWKFGSYHKGICQFAMGDGSVRGLPTSIPGQVLGLLAGRNDGEVIPGGY